MPRTEAGISGGLPLFECSSILIWPPQRPTYKNKNSTIFWCFIFSLQPYFQGFVQSCKIYLSCALCTFDANISASCGLAKTDSPVNEGRDGALYAEFQFLRHDCKLCFLFAPLPECLGGVCLQATEWNTVKSSLFVSHTCFMIKNSLNKFATHDFLIIIISTTNFIFKVKESVSNMFYTLIHVKYT